MNPGKKFYKRASIIVVIAVLLLALVAVPTTLALTTRPAKKSNVQIEVKPDISALEIESAARLKLMQLKQRQESANKLIRLGKALLAYASDNEGKYTDSIQDLQRYVKGKDLEWLLENVEYLGKGKSVLEPSNTVIAYDKTLLERKRGVFTNVLFNDSHVALKDSNQLYKLGIWPVVFPKEATAVMNQFRQALKESTWERALSYCSERVQAKAKEYESAEGFFRTVVPVEVIIQKSRILRHPLKYDTTRFIGGLYFVARGAEQDAERLWWQVSIAETDGGWIIDFRTTPIEARLKQIRKDKLRSRQRDMEREARRKAFEWKLKGVKARTHLIPLSKEFAVGNPMLFRLELINAGEEELLYDDQQVAVNRSLTITNENGERVPYIAGPVQTGGGYKRIKPGESAVLFDNLDIAKQYDIRKTGRYKVQFNGRGLETAISTGEEEKEPFDNLIGTQRTFPSNMIEIEVTSLQTNKIKERLESAEKTKGATRRRQSDAAIHKQLEKMVDLAELKPEMPFSDALEELKSSVEPPLQIVVLWRDLYDNADVDRTASINMDAISAIRLSTALELLLKSVSGGFAELDYVVKGGVIIVATKESLPSKLETSVYDVTDVLGRPADYYSRRRLRSRSR